MFKKIELWIVLLIILFMMLGTIFFGSIIVYHYEGGKKYNFLRNISVFLGNLPITLINTKIVNNKIVNLRDIPPPSLKNSKKPKFKRYINSNREELLVLSRYDGDIKRSVVEIIELNSFNILHRYAHDIDKMNKKITKGKFSKKHSRNSIDNSEIRFKYNNPVILEDGSLVSASHYSPLFKIDLCSNLLWINDSEKFHHSNNLDSNNNILATGSIYPYSSTIKKYYNNDSGFLDDSIILVDSNDGSIKYKKSISEILIENNIASPSTLIQEQDPIHLNDIEETSFESDYWKKGDLFLSIRGVFHAILQYRPSTNELIRFIEGPFYAQHDVDIISEKEISIFNNNITLYSHGIVASEKIKKKEYSEVLIYNFQSKKFSKKFEQQLISNNVKTISQGLSEIFDDKSMLVEEQNHGRLLLFNEEGKLEWEYVNKSNDNKVYNTNWVRILKPPYNLNKLKKNISNSKCKK